MYFEKVFIFEIIYLSDNNLSEKKTIKYYYAPFVSLSQQCFNLKNEKHLHNKLSLFNHLKR